MPAVRFRTTSVSDERIRSTTCLKSSGSRAPLPDSGSRTWMWVMAAPALPASMAEAAICSGVTGRSGCLSAVSPAPVTAQVMKASKFMMPLLARKRPAPRSPQDLPKIFKGLMAGRALQNPPTVSRRPPNCFRFPTGI